MIQLHKTTYGTNLVPAETGAICEVCFEPVTICDLDAPEYLCPKHAEGLEVKDCDCN